MTKMRLVLVAAWLAIASACPVFAQSSPGWSFGFVPTPAQWNGAFAAKQDYLGAPAVIVTGATMTGRLVTAAPSASLAGLNLTPGSTPSSPANGDLWVTALGMFVQVNGTTIGPLSGPSGGSFAATAPLSVTFPSGVTTYACATCGLTTNPLSQFASTTSAQLAGIISDETGSGATVFSNSPTLVTPSLGAAIATSINKVSITAPASGATLTIANGATLALSGASLTLNASGAGSQLTIGASKSAAISNSLTFTGTDATSFAFPGASDTVVTLGATQTLTGKSLTASSNVLGGVTMTLGSDATGDIYYRSSGGILTRIPIGTNGYALTVNSGLPSWQPASSAGSITDGSTAINSGANSTLLFNNLGTLGHINNGVQGQALVMGASAPSFQSGSWVLLNTMTASNTPILADTTSFSATYAQYEIIFEDIVAATNGVSCQIQVQSGGSVQTSGYFGATLYGNGSTANSSQSTTYIPCSAPSLVSSSVPMAATIRINNPTAVSIHPWSGVIDSYLCSPSHCTGTVGGTWNTSAALTGFQAAMSIGNIASGKIKVYGRL